jgi:YfiH family protein
VIRKERVVTRTSPLLTSLAGIRHAFLTRSGGKSAGAFASLNCGLGSGDDPVKVAQNRDLAVAALGFEKGTLFTMRQVHGNGVVRADLERPTVGQEGDALVSCAPGICVGVLTADCVPLLIADPVNHVVAAVHAGWRGATGGVVESAIATMEEAGARRGAMHAAIGPAIRQQSYEVGQDVLEAVTHRALPGARALFAPLEGRYRFDLPALVRLLCKESGVATIDDTGDDTYTDEACFFSYRRACHGGDPACGRQLSLIGLV